MSGASIAIAGDIVLQTPGLLAGYAADEGLQAVRHVLRQSTAAVANLETPLSCRGIAIPKTFSLRADPAVIAEIRGLGIGAVTLANNHIMDYGAEALLDTIAACDRAGIAHCGADVDLDGATAPLWLKADGQRIALLNVACTLPQGSEALPGRAGVVPLRVQFSFAMDLSLLAEQPGTMPRVESWAVEEDQERVCRTIAACRAEGADAVIVAIHWGSPAYWLSPYQGLLCAYQRPLAHALIEAGADAICGHHAHQLHPVEVYRGKPILYCLGNFVFEGLARHSWMGREAAVARLTFGERVECELVPLRLDERGVPRAAVGEAAKAVIETLHELSRPYGTEIEQRDGVGVVTLMSPSEE